MSFGYSVGDIVSLLSLALRVFHNCRQAGKEYIEHITSGISDQDSSLKAALMEATSGCTLVLGSLDRMLDRHNGLQDNGQTIGAKRFITKVRFGNKIQELPEIRTKLVEYMSIISVIVASFTQGGIHELGKDMDVKLSANTEVLDNVANQVEDGFDEMKGEFMNIQKMLFKIASKQRIEESRGAAMSTLSLSSYDEDDKSVWQYFRRVLIQQGFKGKSLQKYKHVLQAYMFQLSQSGLLDQEFQAAHTTSATEINTSSLHDSNVDNHTSIPLGKSTTGGSASNQYANASITMKSLPPFSRRNSSPVRANINRFSIIDLPGTLKEEPLPPPPRIQRTRERPKTQRRDDSPTANSISTPDLLDRKVWSPKPYLCWTYIYEGEEEKHFNPSEYRVVTQLDNPSGFDFKKLEALPARLMELGNHICNLGQYASREGGPYKMVTQHCLSQLAESVDKLKALTEHELEQPGSLFPEFGTIFGNSVYKWI